MRQNTPHTVTLTDAAVVCMQQQQKAASSSHIDNASIIIIMGPDELRPIKSMK
jgi:hypothetical protein